MTLLLHQNDGAASCVWWLPHNSVTPKHGLAALASSFTPSGARVTAVKPDIMWQPLNRQDVEMLAGNAFSIEFESLALIPRSTHAQPLHGTGQLFVDEVGSLSFALDDPKVYLAPSSLFPTDPLGSWVEAEDLFDLEGRDGAGRTWKSVALLQSTHFRLGAPGARCVGTLVHPVSCRSGGLTTEKDLLWMFFPGTFDLPTLGLPWRFEGPGFVGVVTRHSSGAEVTICSTVGPLPSNLDKRIEEALWLVLGRDVYWSLMWSRIGCEGSIHVRSRVRPRKTRVQPPFFLRHVDALQVTGRIVEHYLNAVAGYTEEVYHPVAIQVRKVIEASSVTLETEALVLGIAVESIASREFGSYRKLDEELLPSLNALIRHVDCWEGHVELKRRAASSIRNLKTLSVASALGELVRLGIVTNEEVKAWQKLRNSMAHGNEMFGSARDFSRLCDRVHQMLYRMIFQVIKYSGPYTDREQQGWLTANYRWVEI